MAPEKQTLIELPDGFRGQSASWGRGVRPSRQPLCDDEHDPAGHEADGDATEDVEGEVRADVHAVQADRAAATTPPTLHGRFSHGQAPTTTATVTAVWLDGYPVLAGRSDSRGRARPTR